MIEPWGFARIRCAAIFAVLISFSALATQAASAIVRSVKGSPKYMVVGIATPLSSGDRVPPGTVIKTGANDSVDLIFGDKGKLVSLGANSQLRVEANDKYLILDSGEIVGSVRGGAKGSTDSDPLTIKSPLGVTKVGAADFSVNTWDSSVRVLSGRDVMHEPVLRASDFGRSGQLPFRISPGMGMSQDGVNPMAGSANQMLMQKIDRLVTTDSKGGPSIQAAASVTLTSPEAFPNPGTGTPGYWKTHPEAWPASTIVIGGKTYTRDQAISYLNTTKKDRTYTMFQDLVCAQLNTAIGNDPTCISSVMSAANTWMTQHPVGSRVSGSSSAWVEGDPIHQQLDAYNNGQLCAPHRT